jgi:hypothetical protein
MVRMDSRLRIERDCHMRLILFYLNKIVRLQIHSCSCFIQNQDACLPKTKANPFNLSTHSRPFQSRTVDSDIFIDSYIIHSVNNNLEYKI